MREAGKKTYLGVDIHVEFLKGAFEVEKHAISDQHSFCSLAWGCFPLLMWRAEPKL